MAEMMVSVVFITYNHEKYVRKAILSVLQQETDFPFEVIVGEDCSTDSTRAILQEIKAQYPDQVKLLFREKNLGRPTLNVYQTSMECSGKYVAYLEGDDYWTDTKKLQKQVDFLEAHPEYIAVTHTCQMVDAENQVITNPEILKIGGMYDWDGKFTFEDYKHQPNWPGHYGTVLCRNIYKEGKYDYSVLYKAHDFFDDGVILMFLLVQGDIWRMKDTMSAWRYVRKEGGGNWNSISMQRDTIRENCYLTQSLLKWCIGYFGLSDDGRRIANKDFETALNAFVHKPNKRNLQFVKDMYTYNIKEVVMQGQKTSLFTYSVGAIVRRLFRGKKRTTAGRQ